MMRSLAEHEAQSSLLLSHQDDLEKEAYRDAASPEACSSSKLSRRSPAWVWIVSTFILSIICLFLSLRLYSLSQNYTLYNYETGFSTDLSAMRTLIKLQTISYTGGLVDTPTHTYRLTSDNLEQFVGPPEPEIDARWDDMLSSLEILISRAGASTPTGGPLNTSQSESQPSLYRTSPDVFHQLHCLNMIRKRIDHTFYYPGFPPDFQRAHIDHCIDHVRQALQCHSDLTPLGYIDDKESGFTMTVYDQPHTCRDFDQLKEWARDKGNLGDGDATR